MTEMAASDFIEVRFEADSDGTGKLQVVARAGGFAGRSGAWFNTESVADFAALLAGYPLADNPPPRLSGGFWSTDHPGDLTQELVAIEALRTGSLGQVSLRVHLASEIWPPDPPERKHEVRLELPTTYERLRRFSEDILRVIGGESAHARLEGELMSGTLAPYT
jgi:hypothetical protein